MTDLIDRRAEAIFDVLATHPEGMTGNDLFDHLVSEGLADNGMHIQLVNNAVLHLRELLAGDGMDPTEVVPCTREAHLSTYTLALSEPDAREYRKRRLTELANGVAVQARQLRTEHERFSGHDVFTDAAVDYLNMAVRELERAGAVNVTTSP